MSVLGSHHYQQLMYNYLGDRDYDSFESEELDSLRKKIGYALYGQPQNQNGYDSKQEEAISKIFDIILRKSNKYSKHLNRVVISFVYNCTEPLENEKKKRAEKYTDYKPEADFQPFPVFILRKCKFSPKSCRIILDHCGRTYKDWEEYLTRNTFSKCLMVFPKNGKYAGDAQKNVILETRLSPACRRRAKLLTGTDFASTSLGIASAGVALAASIPTVTIVGPVALCGAGVAGVGVGIYSIGRSLGTLYDKKRHKESMSFADSMARSAYISIIAGAMGFFGAGANVAVSHLASRGVNIGKEACFVVNTLNSANLGTSGLAVLNSGYSALEPWITERKTPSFLTMVQLSSAILFFGHAVYNFKSAHTIIHEAQSKTLREMQEKLKHNKYRKAFEKLRQETIRKNNGNIQQGNAEVIATMRKIIDKDQLFEILTKNSNDFEQLGLKCGKENEINFNGISVDFADFHGFSSENLNFFNLWGYSETTPSNIDEIKDNLTNTFNVFNLDSGTVSKISNYFVSLINGAGSITGLTLCFIKEFVKNYLVEDKNLMKIMDEIYPNNDEKCIQIINSVTGFMYEGARKIEDIFNCSDSGKREIFKDLFLYAGEKSENERLQYFAKFVCDGYLHCGKLTKPGLEELKRYFANSMTEQALLFKEKLKRKENRMNNQRKVERIKCPDCFGLHYRVV